LRDECGRRVRSDFWAVALERRIKDTPFLIFVDMLEVSR
jgi:hypothetical protein